MGTECRFRCVVYRAGRSLRSTISLLDSSKAALDSFADRMGRPLLPYCTRARVCVRARSCVSTITVRQTVRVYPNAQYVVLSSAAMELDEFHVPSNQNERDGGLGGELTPRAGFSVQTVM